MPSLQRTNYALMMFYVREKLWRHAEIVCTDTVKACDSWVFRVWRALCYDQQGQSNEALYEYRAAEQHRESAVPAMMGIALIYRRNKDNDGLIAVERALGSVSYKDDVDGWTQAAALAWAAGDISGARDILMQYHEAFEDHRNEFTSLSTIRAWVDLSTGRGAFLEKCGVLFRKVMDMEDQDSHGLDIDATMGCVAFFERKHRFTLAQQLLNKLIVTYPNFTPALVVKARHLMKAEDWDQCCETTKRILAKDKKNLEGLALSTLFLLVKDARYEDAAAQLPRLFEALQEKEPKNAALFFEYAQCFSRLGWAYTPLLSATLKFAEAAHRMVPQKCDYLAEVGYQQMLRGDCKAAMATFKRASATPDSSMFPLFGLIRCLILKGDYDEAAKQIEFPNEIQQPNQRCADLSLLNAMLQWRRQKNQAKTLLFLDQASEAIRHDVGAYSSGMELYIKLNPQLMLDIAKEYMQHCRTKPHDLALQKVDTVSEKCKKHLELLLRHVPGCLEAQLLLSKIYFVSGDLNKAQSMVTSSICHEHALPETFLFSAQLCQYVGNANLASKALEQALTLDFEMKDQPQYNLLHGSVLGMMNKHKEALEAFRHALKLMKEKSSVAEKGRPLQPLALQDYVSLYLQMAQTHLKLHDTEEARAVLAEATALFKDTTQAGRVTIANAMVAARTDVDKAIEILKQVSPRSEFFVAARKRMADLYLVHYQNRRLFAECFEQLVEEMPSSQNYFELGEAFIKICEPEKAITAYENARAMDPNNSELALRIGRALVLTHDYDSAIHYYCNAISTGGKKFAVCADLATLYWHLGSADRAISVLSELPTYRKEPNVNENTEQAIERVNCALLMYKIHRESNKAEVAVEALLEARSFQEHVLQHMMRDETRETLYQQKAVAATIAIELGAYYASVGDIPRAKDFYHEARTYDESNETLMLSIARLLLETDDVNACEEQCNSVLRINPMCEEAIVILAEVMLRANRFDDAANHFSQLLEKMPSNYEALVHYIRLLRHAGRLNDAEKALERAEAFLPANQRPPPGLNFARGLYHRYCHENIEALRAFNAARLPADDSPWSEPALLNMIEMYLFPMNEELWIDTATQDEDRCENIKIAERLLLRMPHGESRDILQGYCWLASKKRSLVERVIRDFLNICVTTESVNMHQKEDGCVDNCQNGEKDEDEKLLNDLNGQCLSSSSFQGKINVHARVGLAVAYFIAGLEKKADAELRRIVFRSFDLSTIDAVHRARLLRAHIDIRRQDLNRARVMLQTAIGVNQSCPLAWLMLGSVHEMESNHGEAANCYECAWNLTKERDPSVGYKLAFHQMKSGKLVSAIDVCHKVLEAHPNYSKINEVLDVCHGLLRP